MALLVEEWRVEAWLEAEHLEAGRLEAVRPQGGRPQGGRLAEGRPTEARLEEEQGSPEPSWELEVSAGQLVVELELAVPSAAVDISGQPRFTMAV